MAVEATVPGQELEVEIEVVDTVESRKVSANKMVVKCYAEDNKTSNVVGQVLVAETDHHN